MEAPGKLFIFDEPTIGLHPANVARLLETFDSLVAEGNSILVIEHNPELIKCADHVIDLGPEGGDEGGRIMGEGTPEEIVAQCSHTGHHLKSYLQRETERAIRVRGIPRQPGGPVISIKGARQHNLKDLSVTVPREKIVVITGISGSGKSTLAFDLIFAEGQRRYIESLPTYIRQYMKIMDRPDVDDISGIPPTVALEQRMSRSGRRSTVATLTEIYHYLRLLYSKLGIQHCPRCGDPITSHTLEEIAGKIVDKHLKDGSLLLAPILYGKKGIHTELIRKMSRLGYSQAIIDGNIRQLDPIPALARFREHDIDLVMGEIGPDTRGENLFRLLRAALDFGKGTVRVLTRSGTRSIYSEKLFCRNCSRGFEPLDPRLFSFNSRQGQCPQCEGMGALRISCPVFYFRMPGRLWQNRSGCSGAVLSGKWREGSAKSLPVNCRRLPEKLSAIYRRKRKQRYCTGEGIQGLNPDPARVPRLHGR